MPYQINVQITIIANYGWYELQWCSCVFAPPARRLRSEVLLEGRSDARWPEGMSAAEGQARPTAVPPPDSELRTRVPSLSGRGSAADGRKGGHGQGGGRRASRAEAKR